MKAPAKPKIDLFLILKHLDSNDYTVYQQLSEDKELIKEFEKQVGWLIPQWMTCGVMENGHREMITRWIEKADQVWGSLAEYPELRTKLLAACGMGQPMKHKFTKPKGIKRKDPIYDLVLELYPGARPEEVPLFLKETSLEELLDLCKSVGYQKEELELVEKHYDK